MEPSRGTFSKVFGRKSTVHVTDAATITDEDQGRYPRGILFLLFTAIVTSYVSSALGSIKLFLVSRANFTNQEAVSFLHSVQLCTLFFAIVGGMLADGLAAKFWLLFVSYFIYIPCNLMHIFASTPHCSDRRLFMELGHIMKIFGAMLLLPTNYALQMDQFVLPRQKKYFQEYFVLKYWTHNIARFAGDYTVPELRTRVQCFNYNDCYTIPFGFILFGNVNALLMLIFGKPWMVIDSRPRVNLVAKSIGACTHAIIVKSFHMKAENEPPSEHWLDYAADEYNQDLLDDLKSFQGIILVLLAYPLTKSAYYQVSTTWLYQSMMLNGDVGFWIIKPDQIMLINTFMCMTIAPIYNFIMYPYLRNYTNYWRPLVLILCAVMFTSLSFFISAYLQLLVESTFPPVLDPGKGQLRIINTMNCDYMLQLPGGNNSVLRALQFYSYTDIKVKASLDYKVNLIAIGEGENCKNIMNLNIPVKEEKMLAYVIDVDVTSENIVSYEDEVEKNEYSMVRIVANKVTRDYHKGKKFKIVMDNGFVAKEEVITDISLSTVPLAQGTLYLDENVIEKNFKFSGGMYTVFVLHGKENITAKANEIIKKNSISMLWQSPQIIIMTLGELLWAVNEPRFIYTETPTKLRSCAGAYLYFNQGLSELVTIIVTGFPYNGSTRMFISSALSFLAFMLMYPLVKRHKYRSSQFIL